VKIIKPLTLGILTRPYSLGGQQRFAVTAIGFFSLGDAPNERFQIENTSWALIAPKLPTNQPLDEAMPKARAEVLLGASAYTPQKKPHTAMQVTVSLANVNKTLQVVGTREWHYGLIPWYQVGSPQPFITMPLDYAHAFGGPRHPGNPIGVGYTGNRYAGLVGRNRGTLPNLQDPQQPVRCHWKRLAPVGFGPLALNWQPRNQRFGSYRRDWLKHDAPGLAADADPRLFNMAPEDQWLQADLQGGEIYSLCGMHPELPEVRGRIPELSAKAFIRRAGAAQDQLDAVAMRFDTVWFFPDAMLGVAIYHGEISNADPLGLDIDTVMVAYEHRDRPKTLEHYREVLVKRSDPESAALHLFNDTQLSADYSAPEQARRAQNELHAELAATQKQQAQLDAQMADFWSRAGHPPPAGYVAPVAQPSPISFPSALQLRESDFDLSTTITQARAYAKQARTSLAELDSLPQRLPPVPAEKPVAAQVLQEQALARAAVPASDLAPQPDGAAVLPAALQHVIDQACQAGAAITPELKQQLNSSLSQQAAQQRQARSATPRYAGPKLDATTARWLGEQVHLWHRGGAFLAGRDLAGANLSGFDFSGAYLREVMLENADLSGACFRDALLDRASLSGVILDGADFSGASLQQANLSHSRGHAVCFRGADMQQVQALDASWTAADLSQTKLQRLLAPNLDLTDAVLDGAQLEFAVLLGADAARSRWHRAQLSQTVLLRAHLEQADFSDATLNKVVLMDAQLARSIWRRASISNVAAGSSDWQGAILADVTARLCSWHKATLGATDWRGAQLAACDLSFCDLRAAQMTGGLFAKCLLLGSDLRGVHAADADFFQALLRSSDWREAQAAGANFVQADTANAQFEHADLRRIVLEAGRSLV